MRTVDETEVLKFFLRRSGEAGRAIDDTVIDGFDTASLEALNAGLGRVLLEAGRRDAAVHGTGGDLSDGSVSGIAWSESEVDERARRQSILLRRGEARGRHTIVTFNFKDVFLESGAPLLGLCVLLYLQANAAFAVPGIYQIGRTLLNKLHILRRPADADAIDTLDALLALRAARIWQTNAAWPTTRELAERRGVSLDEITPSLRRLVELEVIECGNWGGQADDFSHQDNGWRVPV